MPLLLRDALAARAAAGGMARIEGEVLDNGSAGKEGRGGCGKTGNRVATAPGVCAVFVVGRDAFPDSGEQRIGFTPRRERSSPSAYASGDGKLLSVFGRGQPKHHHTNRHYRHPRYRPFAWNPKPSAL